MNQLDIYILTALIIILLIHIAVCLHIAQRCRQTVGSNFSVVLRLALLSPVTKLLPVSAIDVLLKIICVKEGQFRRAMRDMRRCENIWGD